MEALTGRVPARYLAALVQALEAEGLDCRAPLRRAGLQRAALDVQGARIAREAQTAAMQALSHATGRSDLGFTMGTQVNLGRVDVAGQLLLNARTLGEGLTRLAPYFPLVTPAVRMHCAPLAHGLSVTYATAHPMPYDMALAVLEAVVVASHRLALFLLQERSLASRIELSWPTPAHAARYRELAGARVRFGAGGPPGVVVQLPAAQADAPLPMADAAALALAEQRCVALLRKLTRSSGLASWVRSMLHEVEDHLLTQAEVAALLNVSARTLSRLLEREGVQFGALSREVRHAKACALLAHDAHSLAGIAHKLGYTDAANFSRAFRVQAGMTPGTWRAQARAAATGSG